MFSLMQDQYSIYEAKAHLSQLLRRVKAGKEVIISERGVPIAKVVPLKGKKSFAEMVDYLISIGAIVPGVKREIPRGVKRAGGLQRFLEDRE